MKTLVDGCLPSSSKKKCMWQEQRSCAMNAQTMESLAILFPPFHSSFPFSRLDLLSKSFNTRSSPPHSFEEKKESYHFDTWTSQMRNLAGSKSEVNNLSDANCAT